MQPLFPPEDSAARTESEADARKYFVLAHARLRFQQCHVPAAEKKKLCVCRSASDHVLLAVGRFTRTR
ncbi:hypothetical protein NDU88_006020 [Pleurodeles waltl]|uniref:Uncharacterized protein n=1 Tax=Pleurodeles waltl TaxID=8319 RepID=A0AAV7QMF6_PLEWA|nr:hypothetical protein NDU88_006020 [Pleurodeles waltl]